MTIAKWDGRRTASQGGLKVEALEGREAPGGWGGCGWAFSCAWRSSWCRDRGISVVTHKLARTTATPTRLAAPYRTIMPECLWRDPGTPVVTPTPPPHVSRPPPAAVRCGGIVCLSMRTCDATYTTGEQLAARTCR